MKTFYSTSNGKILHGDNIECLRSLEDNSFDSCISDFPYAIDFMSKAWDSAKYFYSWCYDRAAELLRVMKPGAYVAIFGHPKTNHRMKSAFEDVGFIIAEEIDWIYGTGFPKNQDIGKMFDKISEYDEAKRWDGWKTAGLKPAHEPITIFQKPLEGTYIQNIEKYECGGMNIDACRVPISDEDIEIINAKASKNPTNNYAAKVGRVYGAYSKDIAVKANTNGRFPPNVILDEVTADILDEQTGITKSVGGSGDASKGTLGKNIYGNYDNIRHGEHAGGFGDVGGGSRFFPIIRYCPKVPPCERELSDGSRNPHVTVKPIELIEWLIKLLTPKGGSTIDITAGSCTHAVACEKLNYEQNYGLKWIDIELMNTESEPYCSVGKKRVEGICSNRAKKLF